MINILYISGEYPPETGYGGIGTYTKYIAEGLAARGHSVSVIARSIRDEESIEFHGGVVVHRIAPLPYPLPTHRYAYLLRRFCTRHFSHSLNRLAWGMAVGRKIDRLLNSNHRFDIIETPECGAEGLFVSPRMGKRRIIRLHTPWEMIRRLDTLREPWGDRLLLPLLEKHAAKRADGVSAPSQAIADIMKKRWHLRKVTVIPNPLPTASFEPTVGRLWIYTGRIERRKGVHHLIAAYAKVRSLRPVPSLKLVGRAYGTDASGKEYGAVIRAMIDELKVQNEVTWIENAHLDDVARLLQEAAVAFFPSLWENFPYTCLEAMASGCAVVATRCGGFPEIIEHGETGLLVHPDSDEALAATMLYLLDNPGGTAALGSAARKRITEKVSTDRVCRDMELFYQQIREP
ncbi:MAG: glycosyltransferase family 4 protein [Chitinispirillaceae bacterium]|nr:glycosyltransferase family 4 protein [Chitinispirillaceae bacterium]